MRKVIVTLIILLMSLLPVSTAYASSLNSYEAEVLAAAKKTYEYNGVKYQVKAPYINELTDYLTGDGVDLTAKQRDEVIQIAFDSIETGVESGYLVPVNSEPDSSVKTEDSTGKSDNSTSKTAAGTEDSLQEHEAGQETNASGNNATGEKVNNPDETIPGSGTISKDDTLTEGASPSSDDEAGSQLNLGDTAPVKAVEDILKVVGLSPSANNTKDQPMNTGTGSSVIKNTGFDFSRTIIMIAGMGLLMFIGMIVTYKFKYFAQKNE